MKIPQAQALSALSHKSNKNITLSFPAVLWKLEHSKTELQNVVLINSFLTQHLH